MNIRDMQPTNYCTQRQQSAASVLIVWLLASCSPDSTLAVPERQPAMVPAATTSLSDPSLASAPSTPGGQLPPGSLWGDSVSSIPAPDAAPQCQPAHGLRVRTIGKLASRFWRPRPKAAPRTPAGPVAEGTEDLPVHEDALEIVQNLIDAAKDEQWSACKAALKKLTQVVLATPPKMQDILPKLTEAAEDPKEDVRLIALRAFAFLAPMASSTAQAILPILTQAANKDQDYDTRLVALEALAKITIAAPSEASDDSMEVLEAAAKDQDEDIREIALEALSRVPRAASSEIADTTTVPEDTADKQALYLENLLQLRAAHKPALPCPEPEVQQKVTLSAEKHVPQVLLALQKALEARCEQELTQLAAESAKAELQEQKAPHTQELDPLATRKLAAEPQQALHEEQVQLLSAQEHAYKELLVDSMKKDSEIQKLKSALERAQRNNEALLSENEQLRSAQGKKPEVSSSSLSEDAVSDKAQEVPSPVIDAAVWERYFGDVGATPPLPDNIEEILNSPCPFWEGKQVRDTHLLALIPAQVAGQALTLDYLGELIQSPRGEGHATKYRYYWDGVREAIGSQISGSSYWVLMTKDVLPGSRRKSGGAQCALVERHQSYTVPGALEAAVVMLLHHVRSEDRLYTDNPVTYTRCLDKDTNGWPVIVGDFSSGGLYINYHNYDTSRNVGIAALRKFGVFPLLGDDAVSDKAQGVPSSAMPVVVPISGMSSFGLPGPAIPGGLASSATPGSLVSSFRLPGSSMPRGVASSTTPGSLVPLVPSVGLPSPAMPVVVPISGMSSFGLSGPAIPGGLASSATPGSLVSSFRLPGSSMPRGLASSVTPGSLLPSFVPVSAIPGGVSSPVLDASVWQRYFGDVGATPPLPDNIAAILNSPCFFWSGRQVMDTHLLVLIPSHVAGQPLTLDYLGELIQRPQGGGHATKYRYYWDGVRDAIGSKASGRSYWVLMTRDVLPGSRWNSYADQCALVSAHANRTGLPYEVPGALEAAVVMLLHHVRSGERLYSDNPYTYTRCREKAINGNPVVVGGFSSGGLSVFHDVFDSCHGVAGLRKF